MMVVELPGCWMWPRSIAPASTIAQVLLATTLLCLVRCPCLSGLPSPQSNIEDDIWRDFELDETTTSSTTPASTITATNTSAVTTTYTPPIKHVDATLGIRLQRRGFEFLSRIAPKMAEKQLLKFTDNDTATLGHIKVLAFKSPNLLFSPSGSFGTSKHLQLGMLGGELKVRVDHIRSFLFGIQSTGSANINLANVSSFLQLGFRGVEPDQLQVFVEKCIGRFEHTSVDSMDKGFLAELTNFWTPGKDEELAEAFTEHMSSTAAFCAHAGSLVSELLSACLQSFLRPLQLENGSLTASYSFPQSEGVDSALFASNNYMDLGLLLNMSYRGGGGGADGCLAPAMDRLLKWQADNTSSDYMMNMWVSQEAVNCALQSYAYAGLLNFFGGSEHPYGILENDCEGKKDLSDILMNISICYPSPEVVCCNGSKLELRLTNTQAPKVIIVEKGESNGNDSVLLVAHMHATLHLYPWPSNPVILKQFRAYFNASMQPQLLPTISSTHFFLSFGQLHGGLLRLESMEDNTTRIVDPWLPANNVLPVMIPIPKLVGHRFLNKSRIVTGSEEIRIDADFEE